MKRSSKKSEESQSLGKRLLLTLEFIENVQDFPSGARMREVVETAMQTESIRSLRMIERDVNEMMLTLAANEREGLEALLDSRFGYSADKQWATECDSASLAVRRGHILSEKERQRLERHVEALETRGENPDELAALRALLARG